MEAIEVTAKFDTGGTITPLRFTWQGQEFIVDSIGRKWEDPEGLHILVMIAGGQVYELVFLLAEGRWHLGRLGIERRLA